MSYLTEMALGFGRVLASKLEGTSKAVLLSVKFLEDLGDPETGEGSTEEPMYSSLGVYGRPKPPVSADEATATSHEGVCEVLAWRQEDRTYCLGYKDLRISAKSNPAEGEVGICGYDGGFISLAPNADENGTTITMYAPRNVTPAKASAITIDSTDGNQGIVLMCEYGQSVTLNATGSVMVMNKAGDAYLEVNDSAVFVNGNCFLNGSTIIGTNVTGAGEDFVMLATQLLAWIVQVNSAMTALNGAAGGVVPAITVPTAVPIPATMAKAL